MTYDVIVVGGGVAGLTAAAYLSRAGRSVLVCEKQEKCGGLVNSFERNGFVFDGGIRATENAGALFPMLKHLGIDLEFVPNQVSIGIEDLVIRIQSPESLDAYGEFLEGFYPESEKDIRAIIEDIRKIMGYMDVQYGIDNPVFLDFKEDREYFVKEVFPWMFKYIGTVRKIMALNQPVETYLEKFTSSQSLLDIISQHFFTATPAFFALSYLSLYLDYFYPKGGTGALVSKLTAFIHENQGEIKIGTEIQSVDLDGRVVKDQDGNSYQYRRLLWAADMVLLYQAVDLDAVADQKYKDVVEKKLDEISGLDGNNSIFTMYISSDLNPEFFRDIASEHFFYTPVRDGQTRAGPLPSGGSWEEIQSWLEKYFHLTTYEISIPALRDPDLAPPGKTGLIISVLFDYKLTREIRSRGWYEEFKQFSEERMIQNLDRSIYPGLEASVLECFSSTPLTLKKLTNNKDGAITGWAFTNRTMPAENRLARIAVAVNTPLPNVYQAGQWTFSPSGFPISLITGKLAADKILRTLN